MPDLSTSRLPPRPSKRSNSRPSRGQGRVSHGRRLAIGSSIAVVGLIAGLIVVKATGGTSATSTSRTGVSAADLNSLGGIPVGTLVRAAESSPAGAVNPPTSLPAGTPSLTSGGKVEVLYVGAEYCPYCAAERWPLVMALSKFGTFTNLGSTTSSSTDTNPNTPTFTFFGSTYTSPYISFVPVELQDRNGSSLQTPTAAQQQLLSSYDVPPYAGASGGIPFIDLGGKYVVSGTEYDGSTLSGMSFGSALADISGSANPTSTAAEAVAAHLIGAICSLTHGQPSNVCSSIPASLQTGQASSGNQGSSGGG